MRRSRGYAPACIRLPAAGPSVLAFGAHLKNTVCVTRGDEAFVSPHIGDLDNAATCDFLDETVERMQRLLQVRPEFVAHDLHPDDYSTRAALAFAAEHGIAGHRRRSIITRTSPPPAPNTARWRRCSASRSTASAWAPTAAPGAANCCWWMARVSSGSVTCAPLPLPGGDRAARQPWRMAAAVLHELGRGGEIASRFAGDGAAAGVATMLARDLNCPRTSSLGRLFDAAAGLLGLCTAHEIRGAGRDAGGTGGTRVRSRAWRAAAAR